ncbi:MAG: HPr-rel-A system PqqD family peptide chaperone [Candidatus Accumulibacter sp.]|nr:HPr-rel-A system PqqD family peptide chaperone [Accumulibacter sp.]
MLPRLAVSPVVHGLVWQPWDDVYIVYQPSSTETHVFNETTALILKCLEQGPLAIEGIKDWAEAALGVAHGELATADFAFATARLQELGLIECLDETAAPE